MNNSMISHYSIIQEICSSDEIVKKLLNDLKNSISLVMKEKLDSIGHNSTRSIMWIFEECILKSDFAQGPVVDRYHGYRFCDLYSNMIFSFDGFKGVKLSEEWMPPIDSCFQWSTFSFDASVLSAYFHDMKRRLEGSRTHVIVFMLSVGIAILHKNPGIKVNDNNRLVILSGIVSQFGIGLLNAFVVIFPRVQGDLDRNAIECKEFMRKRKTEEARLPGIESLFPYRKEQRNPPMNTPAVYEPMYYTPTAPEYYTPETVHPSWCTVYPLETVPAPLPFSSPAPPPPVTPSPCPSTSQEVHWSSTAIQLVPQQPSAITLRPTRDLVYIPLPKKMRAIQPKREIRRYITRTAREQIVSLIKPEDYKLTRKVAAKRIIKRQLETTGQCDTENQIIYLLHRLNKEKKAAVESEDDEEGDDE